MNIKLMLAGGVGYILGRTRKGKAALKFAMWAGGHNANVKDLARAQALKLLESEESKRLVAQLRGPVLDSGRRAALSAYERRVGSLTQGLSHRTSELRRSLDETPPVELGGMAGAFTGALSDTFSHWGAPRDEKPDGAERAEAKERESVAPEDHQAEKRDGVERPRAKTGAVGARAQGPVGKGDATPAAESHEPARREAAVAGDRRAPSRHQDFRPTADRRELSSGGGKKRARAASSAR